MVAAHRVALERLLELVTDLAQALDGQHPGRPGKVDEVVVPAELDGILVDGGGQTRLFQEQAHSAGEPGARRDLAVALEQDPPVAGPAVAAAPGVEEKALPEVVPLDKLEPPGLIEEVEAGLGIGEDGAAVEDRPSGPGDRQAVDDPGRSEVEGPALVKRDPGPSPGPLVPRHGDVNEPRHVLVDAVEVRRAPMRHQRRRPGRQHGPARPQLPRPGHTPGSVRTRCLPDQASGPHLLVDPFLACARVAQLCPRDDRMLLPSQAVNSPGDVFHPVAPLELAFRSRAPHDSGTPVGGRGRRWGGGA